MANNNSKKYNEGASLINQLHTMLTNHPERPVFHLAVSLVNTGGEVIKEDEFNIFAREPATKIEGKIEKLRTRGGYPTLKIVKLSSEQKEVALVLQV